MDDNKAVPSTSAHGDATPSQRIKVDKSCFQDIYDTLEFCKIDFVTLEEGIFNESISFTDNRVTHRHSVEQCDVVEVLMKKIKKKSSPLSEKPPAEGAKEEGIHVEQQQPTEEQNEEGINIGIGDETEEDQEEIDVDSEEFDRVLARLNSCLTDDNLDIIERLTNENQLLKVSEDRLTVGIGKHIISKLSGRARTSAYKAEKTCPCVDYFKESEQEPNSSEKEADRSDRGKSGSTRDEQKKQEQKKRCREKNLESGDMYIGSPDAWHGELDLYALGEGMTPVKAVITEAGDSVGGDSPDSVGERTNLELKAVALEHQISQPIQQAITFAWTEYNRHPKLSPLYPTVYLNNFEFSFIVYNPVTDSLLAPGYFISLVSKKVEKNDVNRYLGIFFLWLILNHRFFFIKDLRVEEHPCGFKAKAKAVLEKYERLNTFSRHICKRSGYGYGHISLARKPRKKRKQEPN